MLTPEGWLPVCAYCSKPIYGGYDMHEVILTRRDVSMNDNGFGLIMVEENCVLVHHGECHIKAATRAGQIICITSLIQNVGYKKIVNWLESLRESGIHVEHELHSVEEINQEVEDAMRNL